MPQLYDMSGNVWEWCWDLYATYPSGSQSDPKGLFGGVSDRVMRGGSWDNQARRARAARRGYYGPRTRYKVIGFRTARSKH